MFRNKYSNFLTILLVVAIIVIIVICVVAATRIYKNHKSEQEAKQAIAEFLIDTNTIEDSKDNQNSTDNIMNIIDNVKNEIVKEDNITSGEISTDGENSSSGNNSSKPKKVKFYNEFVMVGYIEIPKTNIEYPILVETTAEALETSVGVLYPTNPTLNEPGNVVIIGHNYRNGKFFSNNKKLSVGDKIKITDQSGKKMTYTIYEIFETTPEDAKYMTRDTGDNIEISLSTCTDDGSKRLVILAKV